MPLLPPKTLCKFPSGAIKNPVVVKNIAAAGLEELYIDVNVLGNLLICFDAESNVTVVSAGEKHLLPERIERVERSLVIEGRNMATYFRHGQKQKIFTEVHLPLQTKVSASFTAGVIILNGGEGDVDIKGQFGEVAGITHSKNININLRGGDVSLNELSGKASINISFGSVTLGWTELRGTEQINTQCGFGGVDLLVPPHITPVEEQGGLFKEKKITTLSGTNIHARVGFGGLDVLDWGLEEPDEK
ncbi:hypothetical protein [Aneurinibacillus migulanus]|uniref:Adhesin domain-containing protein n=2 Tax=Aneurinibacillus migulanus TaxID=47500 RepID=A0A0M0H0Z5_ANEMI|nr:hypothetical protein [Aneurinibacillus migulanus]KON95830.1 hypothetical protein AF333_10370 [Aneurinibacillus migulanus]GED17203.1 hypothetical protein AMI01nite_51940 [Aneurinibacillus migulanus]SDI38887.1 hypothetical protein SAMN04487909_103303 [Aneurinibacillus migulanus]